MKSRRDWGRMSAWIFVMLMVWFALLNWHSDAEPIFEKTAIGIAILAAMALALPARIYGPRIRDVKIERRKKHENSSQ